MKIEEVRTVNLELELRELRMLNHLVELALKEKHATESMAFRFGQEFNEKASELI